MNAAKLGGRLCPEPLKRTRLSFRQQRAVANGDSLGGGRSLSGWTGSTHRGDVFAGHFSNATFILRQDKTRQ